MRAFGQRMIVVGIALFASLASATSPSGERYIDLMVNGGAPSVRSAAQSLVSTGETDRGVLDVAAEVLLQGYNTPGNTHTDAMAWLCKAIGQSGDARYRNALQEVAGAASSKKLKKYANQALGSLRGDSGESYVRGSVNLVALRQQPAVVPAQPLPAAAPPQPPPGWVPQQLPPGWVPPQAQTGQREPLSIVGVGMSMQEVYDRVGYPTSTTSRVTGKAFVPFYYGSDTERTIAFYKGQGRIEFSRKGPFSMVVRAVEVILDPRESGYP